MKKKSFIRIAGVAVLAVVGLVGTSTHASAAPGSCLSGVPGCAARYGGGSGGSYRFYSSDSDLNNNYYDSESWSQGPVNDHVGSLRSRNSYNARYVCGYVNNGYMGLLAEVPYYGAGWVNMWNYGVSSVYLATPGERC
jgi:hypothetical protein